MKAMGFVFRIPFLVAVLTVVLGGFTTKQITANPEEPVIACIIDRFAFEQETTSEGEEAGTRRVLTFSAHLQLFRRAHYQAELLAITDFGISDPYMSTSGVSGPGPINPLMKRRGTVFGRMAQGGLVAVAWDPDTQEVLGFCSQFAETRDETGAPEELPPFRDLRADIVVFSNVRGFSLPLNVQRVHVGFNQGPLLIRENRGHVRIGFNLGEETSLPDGPGRQGTIEIQENSGFIGLQSNFGLVVIRSNTGTISIDANRPSGQILVEANRGTIRVRTNQGGLVDPTGTVEVGNPQ